VRLDGVGSPGFSPDAICRPASRARSRSCGRFRGHRVDNVIGGRAHPYEDVATRASGARLVGKVGREPRPPYAFDGQRKRLELARALATEPRVLLLDEVTAGVDQRTIPELVRLVRDLHAGGLTLLVIEHNMRVNHRGRAAHRRAHLGEVIADGPPDAVARDAGWSRPIWPGVHAMTGAGAGQATPMLTVDGLDVAYDDFQVFGGCAELRVNEGEIVCVLGRMALAVDADDTISGWCIRAPGASHSRSARDGFPRIVRRDTASPSARAAGACFRS